MRKLLLGTVSLLALAALTGAADAQSLFSGPGFFSGPAPNWTGLYAGVEGGYGWGSARQSDPTGFSSGRYSTNGGLAGGTVGYNWEMPNHLVLGAETDLSWAQIGGDTHNGACGGNYCGAQLQSPFGTVRGRLGYAFGRVMPYVTGGFAYGMVHGGEGNIAANGPYGSGDTMQTGWTAGGGVEAALAPHWSAKLEYLYVDLGDNHTFNDENVTGPTNFTPENVSFNSNIVRLGLNYRFW
jgi:outer membrane immunogenic protein